MTLSAEDTKNPRIEVPRGIIRGTLVVIFFAIFTTLLVSSAPPGLTATLGQIFPMTPLFEEVFGESAGGPLAAALALPALLAGLMGNSHACGRITYALARAGKHEDARGRPSMKMVRVRVKVLTPN